MMKSTVYKVMKNRKNLENRKAAYNMQILNKDMQKNDEAVKKFFEQFK